MAKKKVTKAAPRKAAKRQQKKIQFINFVSAQGMLLGIDKNNDVYYWNALQRGWVPNWDFDGSLKKQIEQKLEDERVEAKARELQQDQEAGKGAATEGGQAANSPGLPPNLNRQARRAIKSVSGGAASFE